jgi:hypothetical protein
MTDPKTLLKELQKLVRELAEDLLQRATTDAQIDSGLREAFQQFEQGGRTAQAFETWRDDYLDQVAVAWVLACVFVRFLEDNELIDECWLAGEGERRRLAEDTHELFFRRDPYASDCEYFQHVFREVGKIPAAKDVFAEGKTPLWAVGPSGDMAIHLLRFWQEIDPQTGRLVLSFSSKAEVGREKEVGDAAFFDTRFLGDLYQQLSERARKKFALLQTPVFVEEFILDRTLTPAIAEFGLDTVRMIDPTCGSGHFLLGGFARLFDLWIQRENNEIKAAQRALDGVWGVDINPFAVAIARFRLIVAAVQACGINRLKQAPGWTVHVASGDSLLFGRRPGFEGQRVGIPLQLNLFDFPSIYAVEDRQAVQQILGQGYHAVVGNPPYIVVRDRAHNAVIRTLYPACGGKYSLGVPFTQRFWELALQANESDSSSGYIGLITTNSFMKREFGKKLIEECLPKTDLTHVIDLSGAYIPGHGTPTVILLGRNRKPTGDSIRAVLGIKGEPNTPIDASLGFVWQSMLQLIDRDGCQNDFVSTVDVPRSTLSKHPWSIGGGGVGEVKEQIDVAATGILADICSIGIGAVTGSDDAFQVPSDFMRRHKIPPEYQRVFVVGDILRDWSMVTSDPALFPHESSSLAPAAHPVLLKILWPLKNWLSNRLWFRKTQIQRGLKWFEYGYLSLDKLLTPRSIVYGEIATHNHFLLDRGGKVFNRTAPIIKLPVNATDEDHLALVGLLNSSTACFWLKQVCHNKGSTVDQHGARQRTDPFEDFYQLNVTRLAFFPVADSKPLELSIRIDQKARQLDEMQLNTILRHWSKDDDLQTLVQTARRTTGSLRGGLIALQEELDWQCYQLYGLLSEDVRYLEDELPELSLGQRAFEIVIARQIVAGELDTTWFERHGSTPITEIPSHWPAAYRELVERRIRVIETNKEIALIEKPEYKRRWNTEPWAVQEQRALKNWLLDRLEGKAEGGRRKAENRDVQPSAFSLSPLTLFTTAQLADVASTDAEFLQVAALYRGRADFDVAALVAELVTAEAVPFLPILRYKPTGLRKREVWERTWELQREEDRKEEGGRRKAEGGKETLQPSALSLQPFPIPVPPKYTSADFLKSDFWRLRGKLDVPKERWVSYPHCSTDSDPTLVVGWAGWDHLEQATALIAYYDARKREGWDAARLAPLLAGLDQLLPWIHQWHPEIDPEFGETAGQSFQALLENDAHELGLTVEAIRKWAPEVKGGRRKAKGGKTAGKSPPEESPQ